MNNQQVIAALTAVENIYGSTNSYEDLSTGGVIQYLNTNVAQIKDEMQLAFDCLQKFKCRGFHVEERMAQLSDLSESFGLNSHVGAVRELMCVFGNEHGTQL